MMDNARRVGREIAVGCLHILRWFLPFTMADGHFAPLDAEAFRKVRFRSLNRILMGLVLTVGLGEAARYGGYAVMYWIMTVPAGVLAMLLGMWLMFTTLYGRKR